MPSRIAFCRDVSGVHLGHSLHQGSGFWALRLKFCKSQLPLAPKPVLLSCHLKQRVSTAVRSRAKIASSLAASLRQQHLGVYGTKMSEYRSGFCHVAGMGPHEKSLRLDKWASAPESILLHRCQSSAPNHAVKRPLRFAVLAILLPLNTPVTIIAVHDANNSTTKEQSQIMEGSSYDKYTFARLLPEPLASSFTAPVCELARSKMQTTC
eukprot:5471984-Amphidinium_carterae.1